MDLKMNRTKEIAEDLLGRSLTEKDGMNLAAIESIEQELGMKLPFVLKQFYQTVGEIATFMSVYYKFPKPFILQDKIVFLEESMRVCFWGINISDIEKEDPEVFIIDNEFSPNKDQICIENSEWHSDESTLSECIQMHMYYQCAQGGYRYGSPVYEEKCGGRRRYLQILKNTIEGWEKVVDHSGLIIYKKGPNLLWYFIGLGGGPEDIFFISTRNKGSITKTPGAYKVKG